MIPSYVEHYASRDDWGGGPVRSGYAVDPAQFVGFVLHHTVFALRDSDRDGFLRGDVDDVRAYMRTLQVARPDLGGEVPYSWVVFPGSSESTCIIAEGRGRGRTGAHTAGLNSTRYAWAIAGNTDADMPVTPGMVAGMRWLAAVVLVDPAGAVPTIGHQQAPPYYQNGSNLNATGCPGGDGLAHLPQLQPPFAIPEGDDPVTPAEIEQIAQRVTAYLADPAYNPGTIIDGGARAALGRLDVAVNDPTGGLRAMLAAHAADPSAEVDLEELADLIVADLGQSIGQEAAAEVVELVARKLSAPTA